MSELNYWGRKSDAHRKAAKSLFLKAEQALDRGDMAEFRRWQRQALTNEESYRKLLAVSEKDAKIEVELKAKKD